MSDDPRPARHPDTGKYLNSPGPGRPLGSRNKLAEAFLKQLYADFLRDGVGAIEKVRTTDPASYLRIIASIIPKEITGENGEPLVAGLVVTFVKPES